MSTKGRKRGRTHDAEGSREAIVDAAEKVFAEHGFDGARVDAIAAAAGYNKSLIFQYFTDKLGLYAEVVRRADRDMNELQAHYLSDLFSPEAVSDPDKLVGMLRTGVRMYFDYLLAHPHIMRIYNWEMAEGWQTYSKIISERDRQDVVQFQSMLTNVEAAGLLRSDIPPLLQMVMAVFSCQFYLGLLPLAQIILPEDDFSSAAALERIREHVADFVVNGLLRVPARSGPPAS